MAEDDGEYAPDGTTFDPSNIEFSSVNMELIDPAVIAEDPSLLEDHKIKAGQIVTDPKNRANKQWETLAKVVGVEFSQEDPLHPKPDSAPKSHLNLSIMAQVSPCTAFPKHNFALQAGNRPAILQISPYQARWLICALQSGLSLVEGEGGIHDSMRQVWLDIEKPAYEEQKKNRSSGGSKQTPVKRKNGDASGDKATHKILKKTY